VERDPRATTAQQCSKGLILLKKQTAYLSKALILHAHEIGTFCIDCTGTPYWIPGAYAPALSEKGNPFLRLLKNKGFREERA